MQYPMQRQVITFYEILMLLSLASYSNRYIFQTVCSCVTILVHVCVLSVHVAAKLKLLQSKQHNAMIRMSCSEWLDQVSCMKCFDCRNFILAATCHTHQNCNTTSRPINIIQKLNVDTICLLLPKVMQYEVLKIGS